MPFVYNGHGTQDATQADDLFPALDALAGDLKLAHGILEIGQALLEDADAAASFHRPCLVASLHVAEVKDVPGHVTDLVFGGLKPTGDLLDLVRQEHRYPHVLQIVAERMHVGQQVVASHELPIPGEAVNDHDPGFPLLDLLPHDPDEFFGHVAARFDLLERKPVLLDQAADWEVERLTPLRQGRQRFLQDVGHRMLATFRRLLHEVHRQRGLADSGRAGDERDGAPLHPAEHQLAQLGDAARYWLRHEVLVVCFGEQPWVHEDALLGDAHGTATFLETRATILDHL